MTKKWEQNEDVFTSLKKLFLSENEKFNFVEMF